MSLLSVEAKYDMPEIRLAEPAAEFAKCCCTKVSLTLEKRVSLS